MDDRRFSKSRCFSRNWQDYVSDTIHYTVVSVSHFCTVSVCCSVSSNKYLWHSLWACVIFSTVIAILWYVLQRSRGRSPQQGNGLPSLLRATCWPLSWLQTDIQRKLPSWPELVCEVNECCFCYPQTWTLIFLSPDRERKHHQITMTFTLHVIIFPSSTFKIFITAALTWKHLVHTKSLEHIYSHLLYSSFLLSSKCCTFGPFNTFFITYFLILLFVVDFWQWMLRCYI